MAYKVGKLADIISGTNDASTDKQNVMYVPIKKKSGQLKDENKSEKTSKPHKHKNGQEEVEHNSVARFKRRRHAPNKEDESRTIFVKNVPYSVEKKALKRKFDKYGVVEAVRFRCAPREDIRWQKKVAVIKKKFHPERTNICAFIRFRDAESVEKALEENGSLFEGHHIFVDKSVKETARDQKKAVFLGNVPFGAEENDIWNIFQECGEIADIRIIRDNMTGLGKGFAFVNFKSADGVELAVSLNGVMLGDKQLRVTRATTKPKAKNNKPVEERAVSKASKKERKKKNPEVNPGVEIEAKLKGKAFHNKNNVKSKRKKESDSMEGGDTKKKKHMPLPAAKHKQATLQFQGQQMTDKKTKKKTKNKNELRKKVIAKKLAGNTKKATKSHKNGDKFALKTKDSQ